MTVCKVCVLNFEALFYTLCYTWFLNLYFILFTLFSKHLTKADWCSVTHTYRRQNLHLNLGIENIDPMIPVVRPVD